MAGGKQPKSLPQTPVREAAQAIQLMMTEIEPSSRNEQTALKRRCLARDNYRCIATGMSDHSRLPPQGGTVSTECAHILPFALRTFNPDSAQEVEVKAQIWWAIYRYFPFVKGKINSGNINTPANAITLWTETHHEFGIFHIAFEPKNEVNQYRVHNFTPTTLLTRFLPRSITLTQSDSATVMPDPDFLRLHYQVAMILRVSGIREKFEEIMRENEYNSLYGIQPDGSTNLGHIVTRIMLMDL
ncbi:hypothetical protein THARTR1_08892 [Trichoderma harzianum]|uniref:HNH nuclease domain-containing protein n=1 Tax=Trichoderma harzianum TaxID=5544 RepID=A0A2K0TYA2_TRIHA|nr:hypothetical protein THARTR1_08892 [Trichoderma harzianum]